MKLLLTVTLQLVDDQLAPMGHQLGMAALRDDAAQALPIQRALSQDIRELLHRFVSLAPQGH